ncbi:MAG TPA: hypothetical protein VFZ49_05335 [Pyrinomonadaceae bacterium]
MRNLLPLFLALLAAPCLAQDKVDASPIHSPSSVEFLAKKYWSDLGKPTEGPRGYVLFTRNMQPKSDTLFEFWVKIVPTNATAFNKRYSLPRESAFVVQKATVDCAKRLVFLEDTSAFDSGNKAVDAKGSDLIKGENRSRVVPGSVSATIFDYICLKLE